jgi:hypothetical protein
LVDTLSLLLSVIVHPADVQDRDGVVQVLRRARRMFPFIERIFADGGYAGPTMALVVDYPSLWLLAAVICLWPVAANALPGFFSSASVFHSPQASHLPCQRL